MRCGGKIAPGVRIPKPTCSGGVDLCTSDRGLSAIPDGPFVRTCQTRSATAALAGARRDTLMASEAVRSSKVRRTHFLALGGSGGAAHARRGPDVATTRSSAPRLACAAAEATGILAASLGMTLLSWRGVHRSAAAPCSCAGKGPMEGADMSEICGGPHNYRARSPTTSTSSRCASGRQEVDDLKVTAVIVSCMGIRVPYLGAIAQAL